MRRYLLASVLVAATTLAATSTSAVALAAGAVPAQSAGSLGIRLMDIPTATASDPRARQYIVDRLAPGTVIHRRIEVTNTTADPVRVAVYPAAAAIENGSFIGAAGRTANELSSWTTLDQGVLDIASGARHTATVTVSVPPDAAPGEQYAAVWAEISALAGSGITLINRVGIRMYVSVGEGNAPPSGFTVDSLTAARAPDGHPVVTAQVHNTGGRALDMSGTLSLSDGPGSLTAGPFPAALGSSLAPGQSTPVTIALDQQLPDGPWSAALTLKSGLLEQSTHASIRFPAGPGATAPVIPETTVEDNTGIIIGVLAMLAALVTVGVVIVRRRVGARRTPRPSRRGRAGDGP
jgi:hypothetical protein